MNSRKITLIGAAVAAALGTSAYAGTPLTPSAWTDGTLTNIYYAGSGSAEVQAVFTAIYQCLDPTTISVFTDSSLAPPKQQSRNYLIVAGTSNGACTGVPNGNSYGYMVKYSGGSYPNGIYPATSGASNTLSYPTTTSLATATAVAGFSGTVTSVNANYKFTPTLAGPITPDWGIGDEEPGPFGYAWNNPGFGHTGGLKVPQTIAGTTTEAYLAPFGIAVTANVYAQKKFWSRAEIQSVYVGNTVHKITAWSKLLGDNGSPITGLGAINLLSRSVGSGTLAAVNNYFFNYPAQTSPGAIPYSVAANYTASCSNPATFTTGGLCYTGTYTNGFQDISESTSVAIVDDLNQAQANGLGAIGALGLEFPPAYSQTVSGTNGFYFVAINQSYPDTGTGTTDNINSPTGGTTSYTNVVSGEYDFATQTSVNVVNAGGVGALDPLPAAVVTFLTGPSVSAANTGSTFPVSAEGVLLDPAVTSSASTTPGVVTWTRNGVTPNAPSYYGPVKAPFPVTIASQR